MMQTMNLLQDIEQKDAILTTMIPGWQLQIHLLSNFVDKNSKSHEGIQAMDGQTFNHSLLTNMKIEKQINKDLFLAFAYCAA